MIEALLLSNLTWMKGIARSFCHRKTSAEDLVGETTLKVLLGADKFDTQGAGKREIERRFRTWVLVIMRNTFRNSLRHIGIVEIFDTLPDCPFHNTPASVAVTNESMAVIEECARTSVGVRSALLYAQGYSYAEIADMQGVTVNIVKSRIHHGRKLIIRKLSG